MCTEINTETELLSYPHSDKNKIIKPNHLEFEPDFHKIKVIGQDSFLEKMLRELN